MLWLVIKHLRSRDAAKRRQAAERLAAEPDLRALDALATAAQDKDTAVRVAVMGALGAMMHERATDLLLRALNDPQAEVRQAAIVKLKDIGGEKVQAALAAALRDDDPIVRGRAARLLDGTPWHPLDAEDEVWLAIARGKLSQAAAHGSVAIKPLESVFQNGPYNLQMGAIEALGTIPDERVFKVLGRALKSPDHTVCLAAIFALMNAGGPGMERELSPLLKHKDHRIRVAAIECIARLDPQQKADVLRGLLRDPEWDVRSAAAGALSRVNDPDTVEALIAALQDVSADVRTVAATSLGRIGDRRAIGPLALALKDSDTNVRKMASGSLTQIDTHWAKSDAARAVAPQLRNALNSGDWFIRRAATLALEQMGELKTEASAEVTGEIATPARRRQQALVTVFEELLRDADADLRLAAAESLGRIGDIRARSSLMTAMTDADEAVRRAASEAVTQLHAE